MSKLTFNRNLLILATGLRNDEVRAQLEELHKELENVPEEDADTATRLTKRIISIERQHKNARNLLRAQKSIRTVPNAPEPTFVVEGDTGVYTTTAKRCTCPGFAHWFHCKHIEMIGIVIVYLELSGQLEEQIDTETTKLVNDIIDAVLGDDNAKEGVHGAEEAPNGK